MEQIRRRGRLGIAAAAAIVLLVGGGGDPDLAPGADSATTTVASPTTTAAAESSSSSSTTSTTSVASTTSPPQTTLVPIDPAKRPAEKTDLPFASFVVSNVSLGERTVVIGYVDNQTGGGLQEHVLWSPAQPFEAALPVGSLFKDQQSPPDVTALLELNGVSFAFVAGNANALDRQPTMLTSLDGVHWERRSIQTAQPQQVKLAFATTTPDSPPYPGASAVIGAVVSDGALYATGWVTIEGRIAGVVWMFDGLTWTEQLLPNQHGGIEYGARIAAATSGRIVGLGGSTYAGPGTLISDGSNEWTRVDPRVDATGQEVWGWDQVAANTLFTYRLFHSLDGGGDSLLFWTEDRVQWTPVNLPTGDDIAGDLWLLEASGQHDPIVYEMRWPGQGPNEPARIWILDRGAWLDRTFAGTRIVTVDETHITTQDDSRLYVYDRRRS